MCKLSHSIAEHVTHVQGHKVKYTNCNDSAADWSIVLKFGTEFDHGIAGTLQMLKSKVNGQGHQVKVKGHSVT